MGTSLDDMNTQQLRDAEVSVERALGSTAGALLRESFQDDLERAYREMPRYSNLLSDPKHAEATLRLQGKIEYLESILNNASDPFMGLGMKLAAAREERRTAGEEKA